MALKIKARNIRIFIMFFLVLILAMAFAENKHPEQSDPHWNNPQIRVRLVHTVSSIDLKTHDPFFVKTIQGEKVCTMDKDSSATLSVKNGNLIFKSKAKTMSIKGLIIESPEPHGILEIKKVPYGVGWWWEGTQDRTYEGRFEIRTNEKNLLYIVVTLPMEDYLRGVVPSEIGSNSPKHALCAQAVAARSEALMALATGKYKGPYHDIGSDVDSQAFSGLVKCSPESDEAIKLTRGHALMFKGKPIAAYYASSCGGHTEDIRNVWQHRAHEEAYWDAAVFDGEQSFSYDLSKEQDLRKWLEDNPKVFCNPKQFDVPQWASKNFRWKREVSQKDLTAWVAEKKNIGKIKAIKAIRRGPSGRMIQAEFIGDKGILTIGPELTIRQVFKPPLKSASFVVDVEGDADLPEKFIIRGAGWGHGVGMCQTGAIAMANSGKSFHEILAHYYPKARVQKLYP